MQRTALLFALVSVGCVDGMEPIPEDVETAALMLYDLREGEDYDIISRNTRGNAAVGGACIDAAGVTPPANQPWWIQQFPCNGGLNQNFRLTRSRWYGQGWEIRSAANDGYCLDVPSSNHVSGQRLQFYPCTGNSNQTWVFESTAAGSSDFSIHPYGAKSLCLDVANGIPDAQATIQLYSCRNQLNQLWYVREVVKRDAFDASGVIWFYTYTSQSSVSVAPGAVASFATSGGRVGTSLAPRHYVCDTGNYDTNRVVVDHRTSRVKVSCLHQ